MSPTHSDAALLAETKAPPTLATTPSDAAVFDSLSEVVSTLCGLPVVDVSGPSCPAAGWNSDVTSASRPLPVAR